MHTGFEFFESKKLYSVDLETECFKKDKYKDVENKKTIKPSEWEFNGYLIATTEKCAEIFEEFIDENLRQGPTTLGGKFVISFADKDKSLDEAWAKVIKGLKEGDFYEARVFGSNAAVDEHGKRKWPHQCIMISTPAAANRKDCLAYLNKIVSRGLHSGSIDLYYISNKETMNKSENRSYEPEIKSILQNAADVPILNEISMMVLGGFIAVVGITTVALALTMLTGGAAVFPVVGGVVSCIVGAGFFGVGLGGLSSNQTCKTDQLTNGPELYGLFAQ